MLKGSHSIRVIVLAALVLAVAFSSTVASRLSLGPVAVAATATTQSSERAVAQQKLNSAWQAQLSNERSQLQLAQQQQALAQQAASAQSTLTPPLTNPTSGGGSVQATIEAAFAPLGAGAQQWALCIAFHESGDNPEAVQAGAGGAEGLFQFEPGTWLTTPQGAAGDSIFNATASAEAAAWEYARGQQDQWSTNSMC